MYQPQLENLWNNFRSGLRSPVPPPPLSHARRRATLLFAAAPPGPTELESELAEEELEASELAENLAERRLEDQVDAEAHMSRRHEVFTDEDDDDGVLRQDVEVLPEATNGITRAVDRVIRNNDPSI